MKNNNKSNALSLIVMFMLWTVFVVGATMFVSWETDFEKMGNDARFSMVVFILIGFLFIYSFVCLKEDYKDYTRR